MLKRALVFPGQGAQYGGMGKELYEAFSQARAVFEEAEERLRFPLSRLCFEGPDDQLRLTENTQPAILTTSVAAFRCLATHGIEFDYVAGHSLGEYSAVVAADGLEFADAVETVRSRGQFMQAAVAVGQGAMAAVLGLELMDLKTICEQVEKETGKCVAPANINCPGQIVIAGQAAAVSEASKRLLEAGAKRALELPVSAPFHCALMEPAQEQLAVVLKQLEFRDLEATLVNNVDAQEVRDGALVRQGLIRQVSAAVRWLDCVRTMIAAGVREFVEFGPGHVLAGLIRKTDRTVTVVSIENPEQMERYVSTS